MSTEVTGKVSRNGKKTWYTFEWGKGQGQRIAAGIFTYTKPQNQIQKNHNKEALSLLETKKSQLTIEQQSTGTPFIPAHKFKNNFLDYYAQFAQNNEKGKRHLHKSLNVFKQFIQKPIILPTEITENFCSRFRTFLLDRLTGATPSNYFGAFKRMIKSATKEGYFRNNPAEDIRRKINPSKKLKEFLEADEYIKLIQTPIKNIKVRDAFIFCCYTGLRFCDVKNLQWKQIQGEVLVKSIIQKKTGKPVNLTLHPIAKTILENRWKKIEVEKEGRNGEMKKGPALVFSLPTLNGANYNLDKWVKDAGIEKYLTWSCARLSFSILLQDALVDQATVALLLGHTTTQYVNSTYKRHRPQNQLEIINKLPSVSWSYN